MDTSTLLLATLNNVHPSSSARHHYVRLVSSTGCSGPAGVTIVLCHHGPGWSADAIVYVLRCVQFTLIENGDNFGNVVALYLGQAENVGGTNVPVPKTWSDPVGDHNWVQICDTCPSFHSLYRVKDYQDLSKHSLHSNYTCCCWLLSMSLVPPGCALVCLLGLSCTPSQHANLQWSGSMERGCELGVTFSHHPTYFLTCTGDHQCC